MTVPTIDRYRQLEERLYLLRSQARDLEPEADELIDDLSALWRKLTLPERAIARAEAAARREAMTRSNIFVSSASSLAFYAVSVESPILITTSPTDGCYQHYEVACQP